MSSLALPQDVVNEIITWLPQLDVGELRPNCTSRACALVCRSWLAPSRRNMFEKVILTIRPLDGKSQAQMSKLLVVPNLLKSVAAYVRSIRWRIDISAYKFDYNEWFPEGVIEDVVDFSRQNDIAHHWEISAYCPYLSQLAPILNNAPDLSHCIQSVHMDLNWGYGYKGTDDLLPLVRRLHSLQHLELRNSLESDPSFPYAPLIQNIPTHHLTSLCLRTTAFPSAHSFCAFVSAFRGLTDLDIRGVHIVKYYASEGQDLTAYGAAPPLRAVTATSELGYVSGYLLLANWLAAQREPVVLVQLRVTSTILGLFHHSYGTLQNLNLELRGPADLSQLTALIHLTLENEQSACIADLLSALNSIQAQHLTSLRVSGDVPDQVDVPYDSKLLYPALRHLNKIAPHCKINVSASMENEVQNITLTDEWKSLSYFHAGDRS